MMHSPKPIRRLGVKKALLMEDTRYTLEEVKGARRSHLVVRIL